MPDNIGIVHLGIGAFFRAFGVPWIEQAAAAGGGDWGVLGVSLRSAGVRDALRGRDYVYTAAELAPDGIKTRQITGLKSVLVAPENPGAVIAAMADPQVKIVSLTVTEKGYCHDPATGQINPEHPDIAHDVTQADPRSAPGFIVRALALRREGGVPPFTVMSCDNLPGNGAITRAVVVGLARRIDPGLAEWIDAEVSFVSTMIDRIVPATTAADIARVSALTGIDDPAPVMHEPFRQWAIEDHFAQGRPAFERVGVQMVADVAPYEIMKLRMLNGTHSALAYLGYLAGYAHVCDAIADPVFGPFIRHLWRREIAPTIAPQPGTDLIAYADALHARFANPQIRHSTWQIAMDGSQKLPQRLLGTIRDGIARGGDIDGLLLAVAAWMRYVGGVDERGAPIDVRDPMAAQLRAATQDDPAETVHAILSIRAIFDSALAGQIAGPLVHSYAGLRAKGARAMAQDILRDTGPNAPMGR